MFSEQARLVFSVQEISRLLGLSRASTYEAVRVGSIPSIKVGHRILIPKSALQELLDRHSVAGNTGYDIHDIPSSKSTAS
jgi:excisionase family DNA binding protein